MCWMTQDLTAYCSSMAYHDDYVEAFLTTPLNPPQRSGIYGNFRGTRNSHGFSGMACPLTKPEFHRGVKQDKIYYQDMKDNRDFNAWK
jgi:hypothetical protein